VSLTLRDEIAELEEDVLRALGEASRAMDGILLVVPSYYEAPDASRHPLVQSIIQACDIYGLGVYWGRKLWVAWPTLSGYQQRADDVYSAAYYATCLSRVHAEAESLGAVGTWIDCEPYGKSRYRDNWFKRTGFASWQAERVQAAIEEALCVAPRVDLAYPAGSLNPNHFCYALRHLGEQFLQSKTYKAVNAEALPVHPPAGVPLQLDWWGSWLTTSPSAAPPGKRPLTVEEWCALDIDVAVAKYPELGSGGLWIYVAASERADVMRELGKAARESQ